jgi:hypothetical protein
MPTYCYRTEDGEIIDRVFPRGEAPGEVRLEDGRMAVRDLRAELAGSTVSVRGQGASSRTWPLTCYASGVHAHQAGELRKYLRDRGCPTEISPDGDPIYTSAAHRKKALKVRGMHDRNSFS